MKRLVKAFAGLVLSAAPAMAATDWNAAADAWRAQYRDLLIADAAQKYCDVAAPKPVRKAMKEVRENLREMLSSIEPVEKTRALVKAAGGEKQFCANAKFIDEAKATIAKFTAQREASGNTMKLPLAAPQSGQPIAANAPTPVIDPNIALIRNCRQASIAKLGKDAKDNERFWSTYESCMKDQGAGWF